MLYMIDIEIEIFPKICIGAIQIKPNLNYNKKIYKSQVGIYKYFQMNSRDDRI